MGLAEIAKAAWAKEQRKRRENTRQLRLELERRARHSFEDIFGMAPEKCSLPQADYIDFAELECEGMQFRYWGLPEGTSFTFMGKCPNCGEQIDSEDFSSLAELGKMLEEDFKPASWHEEECGSNK